MKKFLTLRVPKWLAILVIVLSLGVVAMKVGALISGDKWDIGPWRVTSSNDLKPTGTTYDIGDATNRVAELYVDDIYIKKIASSPKIYVQVYNSLAGTLSNGHIVVWDHYVSSSPVYGVYVTTTATAGDNSIAGVIAETIANGSYGKMLVYGYHSAVLYGEASVTDGYDIVTSTYATAGGASATDNAGIGIWLESGAISSTGTAKAFIRAF